MLRFLEKVIRILLAFVIFASTSLFFLVVCFLLLPFRTLRTKICLFYGTVMGKTVLYLLKVHPVIKDKHLLRESFPALYIANHTSTLDLFIGGWLAPIGTVGISKKEIVFVPFFGWLYYLSGHLLIDRSNREAAIRSMEKIVKQAQRDNLGIWIWPEGTRSKDGRLQVFKKGFAHLALNSRLPIVPIIIHDAHKRWGKQTGFNFIKEPLKIEVLPKIDTSEWRLETLDEHIASVREIYIKYLGEDQQPNS
ncbi:lysophospholipid acyltransferase family protein [Candidatus Uabimicrobium amorphum]|uniref:1-acyl-sn-glycerol-3-phosphate acyltransferase n=1 Tax=Uabimicrobium amorphum TaxID=2596890 RepID=A0A5S9IK00_UABAM|nr:lysophospholipid acyltransferase family protein [Candidatus Uabimicrobium amorphum]BBM82005.1 1-acyl-sn-glycerol-3-phosphate acyltransferase [Candidatus Uabimicrobium amorphum]